MTNPAPTLRWILFQLTKAEWASLLQAYSGMTGTPPDPPQGSAKYRPLALTGHWEFKGYLAAPYFASPTTQHQLLKNHEVIFASLGARGYLTPAISDPTRLEKLVRGAMLVTPNTTPRGIVRGYSVKQFRQPAPTGFYRIPQLAYDGQLRLKLYYDNPASPGSDTNTTSVSAMVDAIMRLPEGNRAMFVAFLGYKCALPGGEITTGWTDGQLLGGWHGWWMDNLVSALEDDTLPQVTGTHQNIGPLLDQMLDLGLELDYWLSDIEITFNPDDYSKIIPYYNTSDAGGYKDTNGRYWYQDLYNRTITDKAAWAAEYNCPNLSPSSTPPTLLQMGTTNQFDTARYRQLCQAVWLSQRKQLSDAFNSVVRSRLPSITWLDYDDTIIAGMDYPSVDFGKRFGAFPGGSAAASDRIGRNRYTSSSAGKMRVAAASGSGTSLVTTAVTTQVRCLHDLISLQSNIAGSTLPHCDWIGPDSYDPGAIPPGISSADPWAQAHCEAVVFSASDPWSAVWFRTPLGPPLASQNILSQAHENVEAALYGKRGTPLGTDLPRTGWNLSDPHVSRALTENDSGVSTIVTQSISPTGAVTYSERENILNWAPEWGTVSDDAGEVGIAYSRTLTAASPVHNTLSYSIVAGPGWLEIDDETGALSGTPTTAGDIGVTLRAQDDDDLNPLSADVTYTISVSPADDEEPPTPLAISLINNQSVNEGSLLSFTVDASGGTPPLAYSLINSPPSGAAVDSSTGAFTWTPTEAQGPAVYPITVQVVDSGDPAQSGSRTFSVTVAEVNTAPTFNAINNQTINEHALLTVTPSGLTDPDVPTNTHVWDITSFAVGGQEVTRWLAIDPNTGVMTGTPDETMGGTVYDVTVRVRDSGSPVLSASDSFSITVTETNTAPTITYPLASLGATEGVLLSLQATATDIDVPTQTLTWSLGGTPPEGASITAGGLFTWTPPSEGEFEVEFVVTDNGAGTLSDSEVVTITVASGNSPPVLAAIPDKTVIEGEVLTFPAMATDPDAGQSITYSLADAPYGASIHSTTGVFTYQPAIGLGGTEVSFTVIATDNGTPAFSDSQLVNVSILPLPEVTFFVNSLPVQNCMAGELLNFTITARDSLNPAAEFVYSLGLDAPEEMTINQVTGVVSWTPSMGHGGNVFIVEVRAQRGVSEEVATNSVTIIVHQNFRRRAGKQHPAMLGTRAKRRE